MSSSPYGAEGIQRMKQFPIHLGKRVAWLAKDERHTACGRELSDSRTTEDPATVECWNCKRTFAYLRAQEKARKS